MIQRVNERYPIVIMEGSGLESLGVSPADYIQPQKYNMTRVNMMPRIDQDNEYTIVDVGGDSNLTAKNAENTQYTFDINSMSDYYDLKHSFFKIKFYVLRSTGPDNYNVATVEQMITNGLCPFSRVALKLNSQPVQDIPDLGATELALKHIFQSPSMDQASRVFGWQMDSPTGESIIDTYRGRLTRNKTADVTEKSYSIVLYQPPLSIFSSEPGISVGTRIGIVLYRASNATMLYGKDDTAVVDAKVVIERIEWWIPTPRPVAEMDAIVRKSLAEGLPIRHYFIHPATYPYAQEADTTNINQIVTTLKKPPRAVIIYFKYKDSTLVTASTNSAKSNFGINFPLNVTDAFITIGTTRYPQISYQTETKDQPIYAYQDYSREYGALLKLNGSLAETRGPGCLIDYEVFHRLYYYMVFNISDVPVGTVKDEGFTLTVHIRNKAPGGDAFIMYVTVLIDGEIEIEPRSGIVKAIGYL